jgi:hypothetical protein
MASFDSPEIEIANVRSESELRMERFRRAVESNEVWEVDSSDDDEVLICCADCHEPLKPEDRGTLCSSCDNAPRNRQPKLAHPGVASAAKGAAKKTKQAATAKRATPAKGRSTPRVPRRSARIQEIRASAHKKKAG